MSLQFVIGPSGSGKSNYLYEKIITESYEKEDENFIFIVPEQSSVAVERELVLRHKHHGIINVEVLSFARLAYSILEETGNSNLPALDDLGKSLLIRKLAGELKGELDVVGSQIEKTGYINEIKSVISEFMQYKVSVEQVEELAAHCEGKRLLQLKLQDMGKIYEKFLKSRGENCITSEELLTVLARVMEQSDKVKKSSFFLDGFTGFTPVQMQVVEKLLLLGKDVYIAITAGENINLASNIKSFELFAMSKKMYQSVAERAKELMVPILSPVVFTQDRVKRYENNKELSFFEKNLFRYDKKTYDFPTKNIEVHACLNPVKELENCGRRIKELVSAGYRYSDMAVIVGEMDEYAKHAQSVFSKYHIPVFVDAKRPFMGNVMVQFILYAIKVVERDYRYEDVVQFLKCQVTGLSMEEVDELENYIRAFSIRGKKKYENKWLQKGHSYTAEQLEQINESREKIVTVFSKVYKVLRSKKSTVKDKTVVLYQFIQEFALYEKMNEYVERFEAAGEMTLAKEYTQVYEKVMLVLEKVVALLGEEKISIKDYGDILKAGFEEMRIGVIPQGTDVVSLGDLERSRLENIKVLFVLGVNDGKIPPKSKNQGIFSELEREEMASRNFELSPTLKQQSFIQRFYLYMQLTKPKDCLYLSYAKVNGQGDSLKPSYLITTIKKLYPKLSFTEEMDKEKMEDICTPESSLSILAQGLQRFRDKNNQLAKTVTEEFLALFDWYSSRKEYQKDLDKLIHAFYYSNTETEISKAAAQMLYGNVINNSVTRLEKFANCAYAHFLMYGLQLKEREVYEFTRAELGTILHESLEIFSKKLEESPFDWFNVSEEMMCELANQSVDESILQNESMYFYENYRDRYRIHRTKQLMRTTVATLAGQARKGRFIPQKYEFSFSAKENGKDFEIPLSKEELLRLQGRIDRIDTYETEDKIYVKVIDYKSGNTSFQIDAMYYGLQLQLVLYMDAAMKYVKKGTTKQVIPAGIFYYHCDDPYVEGDRGDTKELVSQKKAQLLKLDGIVNDADGVVELLDKEFSTKSDVIPVGRNKDGSFSKASKIVSKEEFDDMMSYVNDKMIALGKDMFQGNVKIQPSQFEKGTACDFCNYKSVCKFDKKIPGFQYEKRKSMTKEEVMEKIREETEKKEER